MKQHVLLATDFSERAAVAYPHAIGVARRLELPIRVLSVISGDTREAVHPDARGDWGRLVELHTRRRLDKVVTTLNEGGVEASGMIRGGPPGPTIVGALEEAELGVIATRGHGAVGRLLMGSVAMKVIRKATTPVLVIPPGAEARPLRRALLPIGDDTPTDNLAVGPGWAARLQMEAELLHVLGAPMQGYAAESPDSSRWIEQARTILREERLEQLAACARLAEAAGVTTRTRLVEGSRPATEIVEAASGFDLIVMAAHRHGLVERFFLGSVTEEVVRRADRPVLIVRV